MKLVIMPPLPTSSSFVVDIASSCQVNSTSSSRSSTRRGPLHPGLCRGGGRDVGHPGSSPASAGGLTALVDNKVGPKVGRAARQAHGKLGNGRFGPNPAPEQFGARVWHFGPFKPAIAIFWDHGDTAVLGQILAQSLLEADVGDLEVF